MPIRHQPLTKEELQEIREHNKRKLDEILAIPDYQLYLGKKYYGDRWFTIFDSDHYLKKEHNKHVQKHGSSYMNRILRPIIQLDLDGNEIKSWNSAMEWAESEGRGRSAANHVSKCAQGFVMSQKETAYGYKWKFTVEEDNNYENH